MNRKSIVLFVEADGVKGRTVIESLATNTEFGEEYDLRVIADGDGDATDVCDKHGVPWGPTATPNDPEQAVRGVTADLERIEYIVACGWGYKIPDSVLNMAEEAALNCHSSALPDYKGVSVYRPQWAHAEETGGVTVHTMTDEFDEGRVIAQTEYPIGLFETPLGIAQKYSSLTAPLLRKALERIEAGYEGEPHEGGRYYSAVPWAETVKHAAVNHVLRALGSDRRWEIDPVRGAKPANC